MHNENPLVSVCMIAYNHEKYISEAIEGVLIQKTKFKIQLVLGEDKSTDNTREICEQYALKYPDIIKLLPSEKNWGMMPNFIRTYDTCDGKYVALCEGDDYWTDPLKLQKQVDFLESDPSYSFCCHDTQIVEGDKQLKKFSAGRIINNTNRTFSPKEIMCSDQRLFHTCSMVFRRISKFPEDLVKCINGDFPLYCILLMHGKVKYHSFCAGAYRIHNAGITNRKFDKTYRDQLLQMYTYINTFQNFKYEKYIKIGKRAVFFRYYIDLFNLQPSFLNWFKLYFYHQSCFTLSRKDLLYLLRERVIKG